MIYKIIISFFILGFSLNIFAAGSDFDLNNEDQKIVLDSLNNICGDTWCEGEFDIKFVSIEFQPEADSGHYIINFLAANNYSKENTKNNISCEVKNIEMIKKIIFNFTYLSSSLKKCFIR